MFENFFPTQQLWPNSVLQKTNVNAGLQSLTKMKNEKSEKNEWIARDDLKKQFGWQTSKRQFMEIENKYNVRP